MILLDGACNVHEQFSLLKILELKNGYSGVLLLAHPKCKQDILEITDHVGATFSILKFAYNTENDKYIIATETGILHQFSNENPNKIFMPALPEDATCASNQCSYMK